MITGTTYVKRQIFGGANTAGERLLPDERAIALSFNGTTQAVMMATPNDFEDFARGFALTEGLAAPHEIQDITTVEGPRGFDVQTWVTPEAETRLKARRRAMAGPVGCGLCGIDSIEQALREMTPISRNSLRMHPDEVLAAVDGLPKHQVLHHATRATHCAAFWSEGAIRVAREDVGRHNALDKLAGHLSTRPDAPSGAIVLTSRISTDMVQKTAAIGAEILIAVSAPTVDALRLADHLGITVIGLARAAQFELYTHPHRIIA